MVKSLNWLPIMEEDINEWSLPETDGFEPFWKKTD